MLVGRSGTRAASCTRTDPPVPLTPAHTALLCSFSLNLVTPWPFGPDASRKKGSDAKAVFFSLLDFTMSLATEEKKSLRRLTDKGLQWHA